MKDYEAGTLYRHTYYEYDSLGRISEKAESNSEMTDAEKSAKAVSYTYNLRGEVTGTGYGSSLTNIAAGEISGTRYEYNSYGQLTGVYVRKGTSEYKVKEYSYNPDGNVMQVKDFYNYTSGTGQYIALSYSYDAYGRVTAMVYEGSNGAVIENHEYAYNRNGQRVSKTEGSDVTNYFYQDGSVLYTTDSQGNVKAFNLLNVSDILGTLRINGNNVSSYFYTEDMRGSTVNVIDNSGNTVLSYWYDDFGQVNEYRESGNSLINEVQYTGAIYDELTGLLYLNARFYDPATGRFISQDTYRGERDDAGTWHLYAYCANDPVNYVDPSGHNPLGLAIAGGGLAVSSASIGAAIITTSGAILIIGAVVGTIYIGGKLYKKVKARKASTFTFSKGGKQNVRDTGLQGYSDEDIRRLARDNKLSSKERQRFKKEEKSRKLRNKQKRGNQKGKKKK